MATERRLRFQSGGALQDDAFYIKRPADLELPDALLRGELCYVLTTRQMGKSSLRLRAMKRLQTWSPTGGYGSSTSQPSTSSGVVCVNVDLSGIGSMDSTPEKWYRGLTSKLARQLGRSKATAFWEARQGMGPVQVFSEYLEDIALSHGGYRIIIFIDEIDATLSLPFSRNDFFAAIRALYMKRAERPEYRRLTFCLLGVAAPGDLIDDSARTPFNIGHPVRLEDFTRDQIDAFRDGLEKFTRDAKGVLDEVFQWTAGHPYMTNRLLEDFATQPGTSLATIVSRRFLERGRVEEANLQHADRYFGNRHKDEQNARTPKMLALYGRLLRHEPTDSDPANPVQMALRLAGVAAERDIDGRRRLEVRNKIFETVFDAQWVREREADRIIAEPLAAWVTSGRNDDLVVGGDQLAVLNTWANGRTDLTPEERDFLATCRVAADRKKGIEERKREAEAVRRAQKRLVVSSVFVVGAVIVLLLVLRNLERGALAAREAELQQHAQDELRSTQRETLSAEILAARRLGKLAVTLSRSRPQLGLLTATEAAKRLTTLGQPHLAESLLAEALQEDAEARVFLGHDADVTSVSLDSKNHLLATGSKDGTARVWSLAGDGQAVLVMRGHKAPVNSVVFSPDGDLVTGSDDGTIRTWSTHDGTEKGSKQVDSGVLRVAINSHGTLVAVTRNGSLSMFQKERTTLVPRIGGTTSVALSSADDVLTWGTDFKALLWKRKGESLELERTLQGTNQRAILEATFMPEGDGQSVTALLEDGKIVRWTEPWYAVAEEAGTCGLGASGFAIREKRVLCAQGDQLVLDERRIGGPSLGGGGGAYRIPAFSDAGDLIVAASSAAVFVWSRDGQRPTRPPQSVDFLLAKACAFSGRQFDPDEWKDLFYDAPYLPVCRFGTSSTDAQ